MDNTYSGIIISSRIRLARNIANLPFPAKLDDERAYNIVLANVSNVANKFFENTCITMSGASKLEKLALFERHLISPALIDKGNNGAVILSKDERISIMINEEDHVREQSIMSGLDLEGAYNSINIYDEALHKEVPLAYDDNLGFITSCPTNLGTGMRASVMMFLPALTKTRRMASIIKKLEQKQMTVRGVYGEGSKASQSIYQISNNRTLGVSEAEIILAVNGNTKVIAELELETRKQIYDAEGIDLRDSIMRAYGISTNALKLSSNEAIELLQELKLGISLGILATDNMHKVDKLFYAIMPANLSVFMNKDLSIIDRDIARASVVTTKVKEYIRRIDN